MTRSQSSAVVFVVVTALFLPQPAGAQLRGLIKKKVAEAVKAPEKAQPEPSATSQPVFNSEVLEVSPRMVATVSSSMDRELALQAEFRKELAKYPTVQEYEACKAKAAMSPEGQKLAGAIGNMPENTTPEQFQKIMQKIGADMEQLVKKECPLNPADWSDDKRRTRMIEIHQKASAPFDTIGNDGVERLATNEMGTRRNDVLIERIVRYCEAKKDGIDVSPKAGGLQVPGSGGKFYVYTAEELEALAAIDCDKFLEKHRKLTG